MKKPRSCLGLFIAAFLTLWVLALFNEHFLGGPRELVVPNCTALKRRMADIQGMVLTNNELEQYINNLNLDERPGRYTANVEYHGPTNWLVSLKPHKSAYSTRRSLFVRIFLLDFSKYDFPSFQASSTPKAEAPKGTDF
jgi:hypothetical protein